MEPSESPPAHPTSDFTPHTEHSATPSSSLASFTFHGDAREYFRIWIANAFLTIATLGVFSAWAKMRARRYFRGNTELLGHRFEYTADPRPLLIGHAIVAAFVVVFAVLGFVQPAARIAVVVAGLALWPWIAVRSLAFNARHTMWRGLRFRFRPSVSGAANVYFLHGLLVPLTLGLYTPAWASARTKFRVTRHRFGTAHFHFNLPMGAFYRTHVIASGMILAAMISIGIALEYVRRRTGGELTLAQILPILPVYFAVFFGVKQFLFARLFNATWNSTSVGEHRFHASLNTRRWLTIQLTNLVAIVASGGLLYPWAKIRATRYALHCLQLEMHGSIDWIARADESHGKPGNPASESTGIEFGL